MQNKHNSVHIVVGGDATELRENVVGWVKSMRDYDLSDGFQAALDELEEIVKG